MTLIVPVNVSAHLDAASVTKDEIGMNLIDLGFLQLGMVKLLPPDQAQIVNKVLQNMATSMQTLAALATVTQVGMDEAIAQRDQAVKELEQLTAAVQQIDQDNPDIAVLVRTVWDAARADLVEQNKTRRGS